MSRFLLIDADGETPLTIIGAQTEALALEYADTGQTVVAIDPETDTGAFIDPSVVKYSAADGLVLIADDTPADGFESFGLTEVVAP